MIRRWCWAKEPATQFDEYLCLVPFPVQYEQRLGLVRFYRRRKVIWSCNSHYFRAHFRTSRTRIPRDKR